MSVVKGLHLVDVSFCKNILVIHISALLPGARDQLKRCAFEETFEVVLQLFLGCYRNVKTKCHGTIEGNLIVDRNMYWFKTHIVLFQIIG